MENSTRAASFVNTSPSYEDVVRFLQDNGAEVNSRDRRQYTPLMTTAFRGDVCTCQEITFGIWGKCQLYESSWYYFT